MDVPKGTPPTPVPHMFTLKILKDPNFYLGDCDNNENRVEVEKEGRR